MPSADLDLVRSIYADWERGDYSRSDWADPEIEFVVADRPEAGSWCGVTGMARGWGDFLSAWEDYRIAAEEYRALDQDRVLVLTHRSGRGKKSGMVMDEMRDRGAAFPHPRRQGHQARRL
jgi:hypothetical protein